MKKLLAMLLALMMVLSVLTVAVFAEDTEQKSDDEDDSINVGDTVEDPTPAPAETEKNPHTGIALAVLPVVISAAAVCVSKKH